MPKKVKMIFCLAACFGVIFTFFDGSNIWVINYGSGNLMKIKPADGSTIGTFTLAGHANP